MSAAARWACAASLATLVMSAAPAGADDGEQVLAAMRAAVATAHSFVVYSKTVDRDGNILLRHDQIVVRPDRIHIITDSGDGHDDWMVIAHAGYQNDGKGWHPTKWYAENLLANDYVAVFLLDGATARALPNRRERRTTVGAVEILVPARRFSEKYTAEPFPITCTYDLVTYLPSVCTFGTKFDTTAIMTYARWNSRENVVEPPPGLVAPTPGPQPPAPQRDRAERGTPIASK